MEYGIIAYDSITRQVHLSNRVSQLLDNLNRQQMCQLKY